MRTIIFIALTVILISCDKDAELKRSIFLPDPQASGLPRYSEWGYNTFGAYYNRDVIVSNDHEVPLQVIQQLNKTKLQFRGQKGSGYWSGDVFTITLTINNFTPLTYADLISLDKAVFDLEDDNYTISITSTSATLDVEILNGTFEIKRAQRLLVDGEPEEVILSGVFEFQALVNGEPVSISEGRFDVGAGTYNFFVLD